MVILSDAFWLPKTQFGNRLDAIVVRLDIAKKRSDAFWLPKLKKGVMNFGCQKCDLVTGWTQSLFGWM